MHTFKAETFPALRQEGGWVKKFGWYGVVFFFIKGTLWLIIPFIMYGVNSISLFFP